MKSTFQSCWKLDTKLQNQLLRSCIFKDNVELRVLMLRTLLMMITTIRKMWRCLLYSDNDDYDGDNDDDDDDVDISLRENAGSM